MYTGGGGAKKTFTSAGARIKTEKKVWYQVEVLYRTVEAARIKVPNVSAPSGAGQHSYQHSVSPWTCSQSTKGSLARRVSRGPLRHCSMYAQSCLRHEQQMVVAYSKSWQSYSIISLNMGSYVQRTKLPVLSGDSEYAQVWGNPVCLWRECVLGLSHVDPQENGVELRSWKDISLRSIILPYMNGVSTVTQTVVIPPAASMDDAAAAHLQEPLLTDEERPAADETNDEDEDTTPASFLLRLSTATGIFWTADLVASVVSSIDVVWHLLGSSLTVSILLSYLIPCGCYLMIMKDVTGDRLWSKALCFPG
jgi:hypothetical protein